MRRLLCAMLVAVALGAPALAQQPEEEFDAAEAVLSPLVIWALRQAELDDPESTVFRLEDAALVLHSTSGNLNRVAEYRELSNTVRLQRLLFMKSFEEGILSLEADADGDDSRRLRATWNQPGLVKVDVRDTRVFHRLEHDTRGIVRDTRPGDTYATKWERVEASAELSPIEPGPVTAFARFEDQTRAGSRQHTFFQLHRNNCTDCHTISSTRGLSESTQGFDVGLRGELPNNTLLEARYGESEFDESSTIVTFNFGGPFGNSATLGNASSHDRTQRYRAYTGSEDYRVGLTYYDLLRTSDVNNQTYRGQHLALQGAARVGDLVQVTGAWSTQDEAQSLARNLQTDRTRAHLEVSAFPNDWSYVSARVGQDDARRTFRGQSLPEARDRYVELKAGFRPDRDLRFRLRYRTDDIENPFLPTDPSAKSVFEASGTWSPDPFVLGAEYRSATQSSDAYRSREETATGYVTAVFEGGTSVHATYTVTELDNDMSGTIFLDDPLGNRLNLQTGLPYRATIRSFAAGVDVPLGESGVRIRPHYRRTRSDSEAVLLPNFPALTQDSRLDLLEESWALRLDLPAWEDTRVGVGWERQQWTDYRTSLFNGTYDIYSIDFSSRF